MRRLLFFPMTTAIIVAISVVGCLTDSGGGDDSSDTSKYSLTLNPSGSAKLLVKEGGKRRLRLHLHLTLKMGTSISSR